MAAGQLVRRRARAQAGVLAAAAVLLLVVTSAVAGVLAFGEAQAADGLRTAVAEVPGAEAAATVRARLGQDPAAQDAAVREDVASLAGDSPVLVTRSERGGITGVLEPAAAADAGLRVVPLAYQDLPAHAELVDGGWPAGGESAGAEQAVTLHAGAAAALGVAAGDALVLDARGGPVTVRVTGTWRPLDADDPYFAGQPLETAGAESDTLVGPLVVADLAGSGLDPRPTVRWRVAPDAAEVAPSDLGRLSGAVGGLRARVTSDPRVGADTQVSDELRGTLVDLERRVGAARAVTALPAVVVAVLAGATLLLVARMLADVRAGETVLVRARGASAAQVAGWTALEGLALAVPVALLAPLAGRALAVLAGAPAGATAASWAAVAALAVVGAVALLAPTVAAARRWSVVPAGRDRRATLLRGGVDVVVVAAAALALWQLTRYGTTTTAGGSDPLLVAAPALALLAGAVLAARLLPLVARVAQLLTVRRAGLPGALAAWDVARRPAAHGAAAMLVVLGVATGVLTATYGATWRGVQQDAALARTGADVQVTASGSGGPAAGQRTTELAGLDGVDSVAAASTAQAAVSSTTLSLLSLGTGTAGDPARLPEGRGDAGALLDAVRPAGAEAGLVLPRDAATARATLTLTREGPARTPTQRVSTLAGVTLWLSSPAGGVVEVPAGTVDVGDAGSRDLTVDLPLTGPGPWALAAADLSVGSLPVVRETWTLTLTGLTADDRPIDLAGAGWAELTTAVPAGLQPPEVTVDAGAPGVVVTTAGTGRAGQLRTRVGPPGLDAGPVPAVLSGDLARQVAAAPGDVLTVSRDGVATQLRVVAVTAEVPGAPGPAALTDLGALTRSALARGVQVPAVDQWWVSLDGGADPAAVVAAARDAAAPATVNAAALLAGDAAQDPLSGRAGGAFTLALLAAVALAAAGLAVSATTLGRTRRLESAALLAVGATAGQLRRAQAAGQLVVVGVAAVVGLATGGLLALLALPALAGTGSAAGTAVTVRVAPELLAGAVGAVLLAAGAALAVRWVADVRRSPAADVRIGADR